MQRGWKVKVRSSRTTILFLLALQEETGWICALCGSKSQPQPPPTRESLYLRGPSALATASLPSFCASLGFPLAFFLAVFSHQIKNAPAESLPAKDVLKARTHLGAPGTRQGEAIGELLDGALQPIAKVESQITLSVSCSLQS